MMFLCDKHGLQPSFITEGVAKKYHCKLCYDEARGGPLWDMHEPPTKPNKYKRKVKGVEIDVYDVLRAFDVTCPAIQHAVKKLLAPGQRGHKDRITDLREALASVQRGIEMEEGK